MIIELIRFLKLKLRIDIKSSPLQTNPNYKKATLLKVLTTLLKDALLFDCLPGLYIRKMIGCCQDGFPLVLIL